MAYSRNFERGHYFSTAARDYRPTGPVIWSQEIGASGTPGAAASGAPGAAHLQPTCWWAEKMAQVAYASRDLLGAVAGGTGKDWAASARPRWRNALARELANADRFIEIGWVSARRRLFRLSGDIETLAGQPDLTALASIWLIVSLTSFKITEYQATV